MTRIDPALQAHKDWIGFVKPVGLVVSPRTLIEAQDGRMWLEPTEGGGVTARMSLPMT